MDKGKSPCRLPWCEAAHQGDTPNIAHHRRLLGEQAHGDARITVVARWAEHRDGRIGVLPHLTVHCVSAAEACDVDVIPREAVVWSAILSALGSPWLAGILTTGAAILAPHDDQENDGEEHYVTEDAPQRTGKDRFNWGLIREVFDVLHAHGYRQGDDQHTGRAIGLLGDLVEVFEGGDL